MIQKKLKIKDEMIRFLINDSSHRDFLRNV